MTVKNGVKNILSLSESNMYYYHMTSLNNLYSIAEQGLIPKNENNGKLIGEEKVKVFFSEGFEGAIALFVDFDIVFERVKKEQMQVTDEFVKKQLLKSENLSEYLGEGVYLRFDGTGIKNERNFENGCTDMTISPEKLSVCILRKANDNSIVFSRFEIIKYMMAKIHAEQIKYYGASYKGSPDFAEATRRIQEKVKKYYQAHQAEINKYDNCGCTLDFISLNDFIDKFLNK
ncbi:MAG: hypothetical protein J6N52_08925 [Clostridia bacterium]|nr:hypothetical protein [Clostridia bacterium]